MELAPEDLEMWTEPPQVYTGGMYTGDIPAKVFVMHIPTGITKSCSNFRSQHKNKDSCIRRIIEEIEEDYCE